MFGNLSYLNFTHASLPSPMVMIWPWHNEREISMDTLIKFPPSISSIAVVWSTTPTTSQISFATLRFMYRNGISCIWTHITVCVKLNSRTGTLFSNLCNTTKCLLKLHGSLAKIFSTSFLLSKTNRRMWSPTFRTLKPFTAVQRGLKVLVTTSIFRARFVKNFAVIKYSAELCSLFRFIFPPSRSFSDMLLQCLVRDSMSEWRSNLQQQTLNKSREKH